MKSVITVPVRGSVEFDREAPVIAPDAPTLLSVTPGNGENALVWSASVGAVSYKVYFQTTPGVTTASTEIPLGNVTSFTHSGLINGTTYYYRIQAIGTGGGESSLSNELSGTPTASVFANDSSILLDGVNQYLIMDKSLTSPYSINAGQRFSLSVWCKLNSTGNQCLFDARSDTNDEGFELNVKSGGSIEIVFEGGAGGLITKETIPNIATGEWLNICVTKSNLSNASAFLIYINGALIATTDNGGTISGSISQLSTNLIIGARGNDVALNRFVDGYLDEYSFWDINLTQSEIDEIYNLGVPDDLLNHSQTANLVSWWRFGDGSDTASIINDIVGSGDLATVNGPSLSTDVPS